MLFSDLAPHPPPPSPPPPPPPRVEGYQYHKGDVVLFWSGGPAGTHLRPPRTHTSGGPRAARGRALSSPHTHTRRASERARERGGVFSNAGRYLSTTSRAASRRKEVLFVQEDKYARALGPVPSRLESHNIEQERRWKVRRKEGYGVEERRPRPHHILLV